MKKPELVDESIMNKNAHTLHFDTIDKLIENISDDRDPSFWRRVQLLPRTTNDAFGSMGAGEVLRNV